MSSPMKPSDMARSTWERIAKLSSDQRDRVLERSAIKIASGTAPEVADAEALAEEAGVPTQRQLLGGGQ